MRFTCSLMVMIILAAAPSGGCPAEDTENPSQRMAKDILYRRDDDTLTDSMRERCRLDVKSPIAGSGFPVVVWFHGGGLTGGTRSFRSELNRSDIVVVTVGYRLYPDVTLYELDGFDHGGMATPGFPLLLKFVDRVTRKSS